ncbi:MAG: Ig-like domain-containing protein, partial [Acidimicrobiia bacterium]
NWIEVGESDGPGNGSIEVDDEPHCAINECLVIGKARNADASVWRSADLTGATAATLAFDYKVHLHREGGRGDVRLAVSSNGGGSWTKLRTYQLDDETGSQSESIDLTPWIGSDTRIRFALSDSTHDNSHLNVDNLVISLEASNAAPTLDPIGAQSVLEGSTLSFTATASDPDNGDTVAFSLASGPPAGASISSNGDFSWTPTEAQGPGTYTFSVVATDDGTPVQSDSESITVTVDEVNSAPVLAHIADASVNERQQLTVTASATDTDEPDNDLVFSVGGSVPSGVTMTPDGVLRWTPTEAQGPGVYTFNVVVTDDGTPTRSDAQAITVTVREVNTAPVIVNPGNQSSAVGATLHIDVVGSDIDIPSNTLTYAATGLPAGLAINPSSGVISGTVASGAVSGAPHTVTVTVRDNGTPSRTDTATFSWAISANNHPPVLAPPGSRSIDEQTQLTLTMSATDPDTTDSLVFSVGGSVPSGVTMTPGGVLRWTPTEAQGPGAYTFDVVVTDDGTPPRSDTQAITLTVREVNTAPAIINPGNQSSAVGATLHVPLSASDTDIPSNTLTYAATGLPAGLVINPSSGVISGTVAASAVSGAPHTVTVTVRDNGSPSRTDTATFSWAISTNNQPPVGGSLHVETLEDTPVKFSMPVSDPDGHSLTIEPFRGPKHGRLQISGAAATYTPDRRFAGKDSFSYTVSDGLDSAGPYVVKITVIDVNHLPVVAQDEYDTAVGVTLTVSSPGVLANDNDPEDEGLEAVLLEAPTHGTLQMEPDGSFVYVSDMDHLGTDTFTYEAVDPGGARTVGTVVIEVHAPTASVSRTMIASQVIERAPETTEPVSETTPIQRSLVTLDRDVRTAASQMGFPFILLLAFGAMVVMTGRIGFVPFARRGPRQEGTVTMYDPERSYGLITPDSQEKDVFFHLSTARRWDRGTIKTGRRVAYRSLPGTHRDYVFGLRIIKPDSAGN